MKVYSAVQEVIRVQCWDIFGFSKYTLVSYKKVFLQEEVLDCSDREEGLMPSFSNLRIYEAMFCIRNDFLYCL